MAQLPDSLVDKLSTVCRQLVVQPYTNNWAVNYGFDTDDVGALMIGDELQFTLRHGQVWRMRLVPSTLKKFFSFISISPQPGLTARDCTGFTDAIDKLLNAAYPGTIQQPFHIQYKDIQVFRGGVSLGSLDMEQRIGEESVSGRPSNYVVSIESIGFYEIVHLPVAR
ncbi:MAG: hypothetical protein Q9218_003320 [Villophora microphyllina]